MSVIRRLIAGERGATVVLVAGSLLVLVGFGALAVDWGAGVAQRRSDQNAVDFGALGAVQNTRVDFAAPGCGTYTGAELARCNGAEEAKRLVEANLGITPDWSEVGCDPAPLANLAPQTDCVSFDVSNTEARVYVNDVLVDTFFGIALGVDEIATDAAAQAGGQTSGDGRVLPFYLDPSNVGSSEACLKSQASAVAWGGCDPAKGEFGYADFQFFGTAPNTTQQCGGSAPNRIAAAIAVGVDHGLTTAPGEPPFNADDDLCGVAPFTASDGVKTQTGVAAAVIEEGFIDGGTASFVTGAYDGRLEDPAGYEVKRDNYIDDNPIWDYFVACPISAGGSGPGGTPVNHAEAVSCIEQWTSGFGVMFSDDILNTPRLSVIPELFTDPITVPSSVDLAFKDFIPIYLNATFYKCNTSGCEIVHAPGVSDTGVCPAAPLTTCGTSPPRNDNGSRRLEAVTAYVLQDGMFSSTVLDVLGGGDDDFAFNLTR